MQILTGRHSHRTGVGSAISGADQFPVDDQELLLPEVVRIGNPSYRTGAFGKWHIVPEGRTCHPTDSGFEIFQGHMLNVRNSVLGSTGLPVGHHCYWSKIDSMAGSGCPLTPTPVGAPNSGALADWSSNAARQDAVSWIASLPPEDPFFACVAFNAPHEPVQVPPFQLLSAATLTEMVTLMLTNPMTMLPYAPGDFPETSSIRNCGDPAYSEQFGRHVKVFNWMVEAIDTEINLIRRSLHIQGRLQDTVIIVVGDNGTSKRSLDCPLNLDHAKTSVYQLGSRVPLIVWGPRVVATQDQGSVRQEIVALVDLWPTIAEITGMTDPGQHLAPGRTLDGKSFRHLIDATVPPPPTAELREFALVELFLEFTRHWQTPAPNFKRSAVHESGHRYVHQTIGPIPAGNAPEEFLDMVADPDELENLALFFGFTYGASPCDSHPPCPPPGPPPHKCNLPGLQAHECAPAHPTCDFALLQEIFDTFYAPLYCAPSSN